MLKKRILNWKCYADCSKLNFITETDLYNLFGNALDNAIEAVSKINDHDKRRINLIVKIWCHLFAINVENYFDGHIELDKQMATLKLLKIIAQYHGLEWNQ